MNIYMLEWKDDFGVSHRHIAEAGEADGGRCGRCRGQCGRRVLSIGWRGRFCSGCWRSFSAAIHHNHLFKRGLNDLDMLREIFQKCTCWQHVERAAGIRAVRML